MDTPKDIQKTENISKFIDSQSVRLNAFGDNRAADRAYRRAERIAAALHLITNHVETDEPLRKSVRTAATDLLSDMIEIRDEMRSSQSGAVVHVLSTARRLISLVRMLAISGYASTQNAGALVEALDELGNFLVASQRTNFSESVTFDRDELLDVGNMQTRAEQSVARESKAVISGKGQTEQSVTTGGTRPIEKKGHDTVRTQNILDVLRANGDLAIKDICSNLPEYSEKMIQRELLGLVAEGRVLKSGLKRWSRYSLPQ